MGDADESPLREGGAGQPLREAAAAAGESAMELTTYGDDSRNGDRAVVDTIAAMPSVLHPRQPLAAQLRATASFPRLLVLAICIVFTLLGLRSMPPEHFAQRKELNGVFTEAECSMVCTAELAKGSNTMCETVAFRQQHCLPKGGACLSDATWSGLDEEGQVRYGLRKAKCTFKVYPACWKPYFVISTLMMCIVLIVEGGPTEMILLGACCIFAFTGVISAGEAFGGLASGSVVALAFLFPIAAAIEETGLLESAISLVLGNPSSLIVALMRMMLPVAILSAFLSNTAVVAMMIPIIISWSRRLQISAGKMLMPLSFAAQLGGSCTLIGSSHCLVARDVVDPAVYEMGFFDLSPIGFAVCLATFVAIVLCLPMLRSSAQEDSPAAGDPECGAETKQASQDYSITVAVRQVSSYVGLDPAEVCQQLARLPGVRSAAAEGLDAGGGGRDLEARTRTPLQAGSRLRCRCTAAGVVALRQIREIALSNEAELLLLGSGRSKRFLFEAVVPADSVLVGKCLGKMLESLRSRYGFCPVASRGKFGAEDVVEVGDVLLLEADNMYVTSPIWSEAFSITKMVPKSSPPRFGGVHDKPRAIVVCGGMLMLVLAVTFDWTSLEYGAGVFLVVLLIIRSRNVDQVYDAIKAPVLLTVAGAFGVSKALMKTGVAECLATSVVAVAKCMGPHGIRAATYLVATGMSMFINNSATIAIVGPMVESMAEDGGGVSVASLVWVLVLAAGSCFTTPLGYQTNMMVMKDGGYVFTDFMRYGALVQLCHMALTLLTACLLCDVWGMGGQPPPAGPPAGR